MDKKTKLEMRLAKVNEEKDVLRKKLNLPLTTDWDTSNALPYDGENKNDYEKLINLIKESSSLREQLRGSAVPSWLED